MIKKDDESAAHRPFYFSQANQTCPCFLGGSAAFCPDEAEPVFMAAKMSMAMIRVCQ